MKTMQIQNLGGGGGGGGGGGKQPAISKLPQSSVSKRG